MNKPQIIVVGGGISGLVASWIFQDVADVRVFEPGEPGGEFTSGGLKYIHRTDGMEEMFTTLDIPYSTYIVRGGILLRGQLYLYPQVLRDMAKHDVERIQNDHYRKTRRSSPEGRASKAMNDPAAVGPRRALRCDFEEMIETLVGRAFIIKSMVTRLDHRRNVLFDADGAPHRYDHLILTAPLWTIRRMCSFYVPEGATMRLNVAQVSVKKSVYAAFDYVYTPYTPADSIHRFSPNAGGYSVEINGDLDYDKLNSDLAFIFPEGYAIESVHEGLKGHLLPLPEPVQWPDNVAPLGRFAKWDARSTIDVVLEDALLLKKRWKL